MPVCFRSSRQRHIRSAGGLLAAYFLLFAPFQLWAQEGAAIVAALEDQFTKVIENAEPSVVSIARIGKVRVFEPNTTGELHPPDQPAADPSDFVPSEFGSGVIFEPPDQPGERFILTMYHVVKGGQIAGRDSTGHDDLVIHTHKRHKARVEILAADPRSDLAVLAIKAGEPLKPSELTPIRFAKNHRHKKGQFVLTLGNPYAIARDGSASAGWGMLSNISRSPKPIGQGLPLSDKMSLETLHHQGTLLQIDGQLNLGTSGGAVLNRQGELIGLITAMAALDGYEKSVGYAVPINNGILRVITELARGFEVDYGLLGIQPLTTGFQEGDQPTAVKAEIVGPGSPAADAGVVREDVIYSINGETIYSREDLMREVALIGPGRIAKLQIYRPATRQWLTKNVTLTKWPVLNEKEIIATRFRHEWGNIVIDYATARYDSFTNQYRSAVLVTHLKAETPGQISPLRVGDFLTHIDNQPVRSPEEFDEVMKTKTTGIVNFRLMDGRNVSVRATN